MLFFIVLLVIGTFLLGLYFIHKEEHSRKYAILSWIISIIGLLVTFVNPFDFIDTMSQKTYEPISSATKLKPSSPLDYASPYMSEVPSFDSEVNSEDSLKSTESSFQGSFISERQKKEYTYTAPIGGRYIFLSELNDANYFVKFEIYDSKNELIKETTLYDKDHARIDLEAGARYRIVMSQYEGMASYKIQVGIPKEVTSINGASIVGSLDFPEQQDRYSFTTPISGIYSFMCEFNNANHFVSFDIFDSKNGQIKDVTLYEGDDTSIDLTAGQTYSIIVSQYEGQPQYEIKIGVPIPIQAVNDNILDGRFTFPKQENHYIYTASATATYTFAISLENANDYVKFYVYDVKKAQIKNITVYNGDIAKIDMVANQEYEIVLGQYNGLAAYNIAIASK